ncbi:MAG: type II toxin-antitoxin system ParD family antitoxin [Scytonematopsis contorta HA4267-MV1]|jgi:antitoxin ParD1/3/4|nr:type II toxin-antitoxin system ParD family antitoxin [Scytonematopsis contorta HA4267-MV1]
MTLLLTPELEMFIQSQVASGKYTSTNEVIIAALKLLEERERIYQGRFEELQREIAVGLEEAERGELIDADTVFNRLREKLAKRRIQENQ